MDLCAEEEVVLLRYLMNKYLDGVYIVEYTDKIEFKQHEPRDMRSVVSVHRFEQHPLEHFAKGTPLVFGR